jgi:AcrR family transcriptional regulator
VIVLGDARTNGRAPGTDAFAQIAARAGVSSATIFLRYPTKDALFFAVVSSSLAARILPLLPTLPEQPTPESALRLLAAQLLGFFREFAPLFMMSAGAGRDRLCHALPAENAFEEVHRGVTAWFQAEMDAGRFRRVDPTILGRAFAGMLADYAMGEASGLVKFVHPGAEAYLDGVVDLTLHGLLPR